jgi:hypothetical protein
MEGIDGRDGGNRYAKETRKFYRKVNIIRKGYKPRIRMCKDKMGNLVTEKKKVLQRWAEQFDELLNGHGNEDRNKGHGNGEGETEETGESLDKEKEEEFGADRNLEMTDVPTKEEVKAAVESIQISDHIMKAHLNCISKTEL